MAEQDLITHEGEVMFKILTVVDIIVSDYNLLARIIKFATGPLFGDIITGLVEKSAGFCSIMKYIQ